MVDKSGHFPNLVEITGHIRVFGGQNRAYINTIDFPFEALLLLLTLHSCEKKGPYARCKAKKKGFTG